MVRRARITPERAGLPSPSDRRRVVGLRRAEVAALAGISPGYYKRVERGVVGGISASVLAGLARALQLNDAERAYLADLVRGSSPSRLGHPAPPAHAVRPFVQELLAATSLPCCVLDDRLDVLAANDLARALYLPLYESADRPVNQARFTFYDAASRDYWSDWDAMADLAVSLLRGSSGRDPVDPGLAGLITELRAHSTDFRTRWAAYDVASDTAGVREINHPLVGHLTLETHSIPLPEDPGQRVLVHTPCPAAGATGQLALLASCGADLRAAGVPRPRGRHAPRGG
ncbi:helix-turn-helix domain-containing protein [Cellulomonas humilata]|uniref:Helix-turn-helix domain-containing protein n=2 Tax=Cellulomonas humilata TaxID=144055 RepID=A0A7Y6A604_9CELL|nr:helix-turn-helix transcriptional regulator [Cellulomonas humilata]NUU19713.1 helix-turn-helix domain-containing protein [Cellulomonas humilata]